MSGSKMFENFLFNYNMTFIKFTKSLIVRDKVREYLEKDPAYRSDDDIEVLLEFMQHMPAFSNMTLSMRRELCAVMVFAVVDKADTVVLNDGEQLDTWSVILNGHVEISKPDGTIEHLHMGDSFGVAPTLEIQYHCGTMRTKADDCQFVCIAQSAYHQIFHKGEESMVRVEENGELVLVVEKKKLNSGHRIGQIVLRAMPEKLITHLIEDNEADSTYIEDFLLTYRTFLRSPTELTNRLVAWFCDPVLREKVVKIVLLWTSNHFLDFDTEPGMSEFLEKFEVLLEGQKLSNSLQALHSIYAAKSRPRSVTLSRANRDDPLCFSIIGGSERNASIFISKVEKGSRASEAGLKRGDQILEVNNCIFEFISLDRAFEVLRSSTHLALTVRSNLYLCRQLLKSPENSPRHTRCGQFSMDQRSKQKSVDGDSCSASSTAGSPSKCLHNRHRDKCSVPAQPSKIRKALLRFNLLQRADSGELQLNHEFFSSHPCSRKGSSLSESSGLGQPLSTSDPDLVSSIRGLERQADVPDHVIRVYRADQSFRYLPIHKETTAREVVMLALTEFGISDPSCNYSLCEITFEECGTRTKHLPDQLSDLADRCRLNSRYYLKNTKNIETLVPDDLAAGILRECQVSLLQLLPAEVAIQLTLRDFQLFQSIPPTEYINDLFELESRTGSPNLSQFSDLVNREMFWVVSEVCAEQNQMKRTKIIKHFIKIAKYCRMARNFNSFFAILSGLGHGSVSRLRLTWDKLSTKYIKLFEEMQDVMDPSRNMSKYRNMLSAHLAHPPVIPFFPLVKKDLTFIHFGNDSRVDGLVNFDKLRMIAKEIRQVNRLATISNYGKTTWPYENILPDFSCLSTSVHGTLRHKKSTVSSILNPKKMYDEAIMARRVRTYLVNLKVIDDEVKLSQMSNHCEPPGQTNPNKTEPASSSSLISRSTVSSTKSEVGFPVPVTIPIFGATSPTSVRKLLSLSNRTRPFDPKKRPRASCPPPSPVNPLPPPPPARLSSRTAGRSEGFQQKRLQNPLRVAAVNLSEESSSVTSGLQRSPTAHLYEVKRCEGPLKKVAQKLLMTNGKMAQKQLDSDSGHSSIASSSSSGGDGHSPLSSDPEQCLGLTTDLAYHPEMILPISPSDGMPILKNSPTAGSPSPPTSGFHRKICRLPSPSHQRFSQFQTVGLGNGISSVPLAFWKLEEMKKRQMRTNFQRRTLSYDGSSEFSDLHSENDWQLIGGCDDDDVEELVSLV